MPRATRLIRKADLAGRVTVDTITLDREARFKRRMALSSDHRRAFLLDLPEATHMGDGDALELDDTTLIGIRAAAEPLLEIHTHGAAALARIAWHIGNRHIPCEVTDAAIYIQPDHVLEAMVEGLGARVRHVSRPFEPEGGAYGGNGPLDKGHHHHGADDHNHSHDVKPAQVSHKVWRPD
jgi:urease accessory protein